MHEYSINNRSRITFLFLVAFVAILLCPVVNSLVARTALVGPIASSSIFFALFLLVDRLAWKHRPLVWCFSTPDLSGQWTVEGRTSGADGIERDWSATATITQNWTTISVVLRADGSTSQSNVAAIEILPGQGCRLAYAYANRRNNASGLLIDHRGMCELEFSDELNSATAIYFNNHDRQTTGDMTWTRTK